MMITIRTIFLYLFCLGTLAATFFCHSLDRYARMNPFDPNGSNWFPPTVEIVKDTIIDTVSHAFEIEVKVSDQNGSIDFLDWTSEPAFIDILDPILAYKDTTLDSLLLEMKPQIDSTDTTFFDTTGIDTTKDSVATHTIINENDTTIYVITFGLGDNDTLSFYPSADSTYFFKYAAEDSLYYKYLREKKTEIKYDTTYVPIYEVVQVFLASSWFVIDTAGVYKLWVTAIDNYGIPSTMRDSIVVIMHDTSSQNSSFSPPNQESSVIRQDVLKTD